MEDALDHISARVTLAGGVGSLGGVALALYRGHVIPRTAGLTGLSCALSATVCVGLERVFHQTVLGDKVPTLERTCASHVLGGFFGGALLGGLYVGKPLRGSFFFVPVMMIVGMGEYQLQGMREQLQQEVQQEIKK